MVLVDDHQMASLHSKLVITWVHLGYTNSTWRGDGVTQFCIFKSKHTLTQDVNQINWLEFTIYKVAKNQLVCVFVGSTKERASLQAGALAQPMGHDTLVEGTLVCCKHTQQTWHGTLVHFTHYTTHHWPNKCGPARFNGGFELGHCITKATKATEANPLQKKSKLSVLQWGRIYVATFWLGFSTPSNIFLTDILRHKFSLRVSTREF